MRVKICVKVFFPMERAALQRTALCDHASDWKTLPFSALETLMLLDVLTRMKYTWMLNNIRKLNLYI